MLSTPSSVRPEDISSDARTEREWIVARIRKVPQLICMYVVGIVVQIEEARLGNQFMMAAAQLVDWSGKGKPHDRQGPRLASPVNFAGRCKQARLRPMGRCPVWRSGEVLGCRIGQSVIISESGPRYFDKQLCSQEVVKRSKEQRTVNLQSLGHFHVA